MTALAILAPSPAGADLCAAAARLAGIRDAYLSLDRGAGRDRDDAAIALLALHLPSARPADMAETMRNAGIPTSEERLEEALEAAARRARNVLTGNATARTDHEAHRVWLSELVNSTGCQGEWRDTAATTLIGGVRDNQRDDDAPDAASEVIKYLAIILGGTCAAFGAILVRRSRVYRKGELQRMPRHAVSLPATVDFDTPDGPGRLAVRILDLSLGGAKAAWPDAPDEGTGLTLSLEEQVVVANIVWRNEHYAGLLFDVHLEPEALDALTAAGAPGSAD